MQNNKEITTQLGHKIVIKEFLTYDDLEPTLKIEDTIEKSNKIMEIAIISVDGVSDGAYKAVRALPISEYKAISKEVTDMLNGNFSQAK